MIENETIDLYKLQELSLFKDCSPHFFQYLMDQFTPLYLQCGETLFKEGEASDDLFLIAGGRLRFIKESTENEILNELGRGELIGELAALTQSTRKATATAIRDSLLLQLSRQSFEEILVRFPHELIALISPSITRLTEGKYQPKESSSSEILLYFNSPLESEQLVEVAKRQLLKHGTCKVLTKNEASSLFTGDELSDEIMAKDSRFNSWLTDQQINYRYNLYVVVNEEGSWGRKCCRECDRALIFCEADKLENLHPASHKIIEEARRLEKTIDIVLIYPHDTQFPSRTKEWMEKFPFASFHHIKKNSTKDLERVIRIISGNSISLVLSGGGASALVQLGLYKALFEMGIPIDCVAGSCTGSFIAALIAMGKDPASTIEIAKYGGPKGTRGWVDLTLPIISLAAGKTMNKYLQETFGELLIEDLLLPLYIVATNLNRKSITVLKEGEVWKAVRFSSGLPVIYPPFPSKEGELLVDGAVLNNLPIDVLQSYVKTGRVIAARLHKPEIKIIKNPIDKNSIWKKIKKNLFNRSKTIELNILEILARTTMMSSRIHAEEVSKNADICFEFHVTNVGFFDNTADTIEKLVEIGYKKTMERGKELEKFIDYSPPS